MLSRQATRLVALGLLALSALGCGAAAEKSMSPPSRYADGLVATAAMEPAPEMAGGMPGGGEYDGRLASMGPPPAPMPAATATGPATGPAPTVETPSHQAPMLIYTATLNLAVFQVVEASKQVETMARESGGFLARRDDTSIVIRVPAAKFEDMMKRLEKLGDVLHRNVVAEDVTEQYMDAEVRLKNARAVRDRLQELLKQANKVEDSLAIEKELTRVGTEIETLEGKLKYLRDRAAYSTITVTFQPKRADNVNANAVKIPVPWLEQLGLGRLLDL